MACRQLDDCVLRAGVRFVKRAYRAALASMSLLGVTDRIGIAKRRRLFRRHWVYL